MKENKLMIKITKVKKNQLSELASIYVKSYKTAIIPEFWTPKITTIFMDYLLKRQPDMFFVATMDGKIAGGIVAGIKPWHDGNHIYDVEVFVDPRFQKIGLAKKLYAKLLTEGIKKHGVTTMEFTTFDKESFLLSWYKKIGMEKVKDLLYMTGNAKEILKNLKNG